MPKERLVVLNGPLQGMSMEITGALTLGRSHENSLQVNDLQVSRQHAVIEPGSRGTMLRDLSSGNGTFVGGHRVQEYRLSPGDVISIGPVEIRYETAQTEAPESPETTRSVVFHSGEASSVQASSVENVYQTFFDAARQSGMDEQLRSVQSRLAAVYEATQIISSERDITKVLAQVMDQLFSLVPGQNGVILLRDTNTGELTTEYVVTGTGQNEVTISSSIVQRSNEQGEAVITYNAAADDRFDSGMSIITQNITSAMCVPLAHQGVTLGVIYIDNRGATHAFSQSDLQLMVALSQAAAIAIRNAQYVAQLEQAYQDTLIVLSNAIELRDHYTVGHTWRVTRFAMEIGKRLGWDEEKLDECEMGGILHDVGKIAIDDAILRKPGGLTSEEFAKMKVHPERGARLMQDVEFLMPLIPYALYHHERWDGKGYPFGLSGENIPMEGRVLAVADTLDAMTSNRPYRKGMDPAVALEEIQKMAGTQFDPQIVELLVACHQDGSINRILQNYHEQDGHSIACPFCSTYITVPEDLAPDMEIQCGVCHRRIVVRYQNDMYYGELLAETEPLSYQSTPTDSRSSTRSSC